MSFLISMVFFIMVDHTWAKSGAHCPSSPEGEHPEFTLNTLSDALPIEDRIEALKHDYLESGMCDPTYNYANEDHEGLFLKAIHDEAKRNCHSGRKDPTANFQDLENELKMTESERQSMKTLLENCLHKTSDTNSNLYFLEVARIFHRRYRENPNHPPGKTLVHKSMSEIHMLELDDQGQINCEKEFINSDALKKALQGYGNLKKKKQVKNSRYLTVVDYTKPSNSRRMYVIDMMNNRIVNQTWVAHGGAAGIDGNGPKGNDGYGSDPTLSNQEGSGASSEGFIRTLSPYQSQTYGYSLRLEGLEPGNKNIFKRAIVLHPWGSQNLVSTQPDEFKEALKQLDSYNVMDPLQLNIFSSRLNSQSLSEYIASTDGCLGVSNRPSGIRNGDGTSSVVSSQSDFLVKQLSGGSIIFNYSGKDQRSPHALTAK